MVVAMVVAIAHSHQGTLDIQTTLGKGTSVRVLFPTFSSAIHST